MRARAASRLAWLLWASTALASAASIAIVWLSRSAAVSDVIGFRGFDAVLAIVFASVGVVVVAQRPSHPVGWLLFAFGGGNAPISLLQQYAFFAIVGRSLHPLPGGVVAAWAQEWISVSQGALFVLLLLLFPTGRLPSRRWRPVVGLAIAGSLLETLGGAFLSGPIPTFRALNNPFGLTGTLGRVVAIADAAGNALFIATVLAAVVSIILRFRRAERVERQQLKWIAAAATLVGLALVGFVLTGQEAGRPPFGRPVQIFLILAIAGVPVAVGIAIVRHQLFDIDRLISRTTSFAMVTVILGGLFAIIALVPTAVVGAEDSPDWLIAAATLLTAALVRPLRRRVQNAVEFRFNRARYDAVHTIETFATRLREEIDLDALGAEFEAHVAQTMHPTHVSLWLRGSTR